MTSDGVRLLPRGARPSRTGAVTFAIINREREGGLTMLRIGSTIVLVAGSLWLFSQVIRAHYFPISANPATQPTGS